MTLASVLPSFDDRAEGAPDAFLRSAEPKSAVLRSAVVKSAVLRDRELTRAQQNQVALERERHALLAEQERTRTLLERAERARIEDRTDTARRALDAISELAARTTAAREASVNVAARDTIEAAAELAAWFLRARTDDPRDPAGARALTERLRDAIEDMLPSSPPVIAVSPQDLDEVVALLGEHGDLAVEVRADGTLAPGEARIDAGDSHADLTISGALRRAVDSLVGGAGAVGP